jgi:hypothetical protein
VHVNSLAQVEYTPEKHKFAKPVVEEGGIVDEDTADESTSRLVSVVDLFPLGMNRRRNHQESPANLL